MLTEYAFYWKLGWNQSVWIFELDLILLWSTIFNQEGSVKSSQCVINLLS